MSDVRLLQPESGSGARGLSPERKAEWGLAALAEAGQRQSLKELVEVFKAKNRVR